MVNPSDIQIHIAISFIKTKTENRDDTPGGPAERAVALANLGVVPVEVARGARVESGDTYR